MKNKAPQLYKANKEEKKSFVTDADNNPNIIVEKLFCENEEKYHTIFDANRDSITIFRINPDNKPGNYIEANPAATELFGYSKQELMHMSVSDVDFVSDKTRKKRIETLLSKGKIDFETIIKNKKGESRNIEVNSLIIDYLNEPAVMNITRDITERKLLEIKAKKANENLATILESIPYLLFEVGLDGTIHHFQSHRNELPHFSPDSFVLKKTQNVFPADVSNKIFEAINEASAKGWSTGHQFSIDLSEKKHWFELSVSPIKGDKPKNKHFIILARDISIRKKAEEALRENEEKLEEVFNVANSGILIIDKSNKFSLHNDWCCEMFGYTKEEFEKLTILDITYPDDINKSKEYLKDIFEGTIDKYQIEKRYLRKDKSFFWGEITVSAIKDKNNKVTNVIVVISDITERKKTEEKLIANDEFLNQIQIIANIGSYLFDFTTGKWTSSPVLDGIYGIDEHFEKTVEGWRSIIHPEWKDIMKTYFEEEILIRRKDFSKDYKIIRINDQEERWVYGTGKIIYNKHNEPIQLIGTIQDISKQKKSEDSLRESEEKYRSLVENSPDAVVIYIDGNVVFVNNEAVRMIGAKNKNELIGKSVLQFIHPDSMESVIQKMIDMLKDDNASDVVEEKFIDLSGKTIHVEIKGIPTIYEQQVAVQVIIHDITERKRTQEKIRQLSQAVEQSPVTIIITNTEGAIEYVNPKFIETTGYTFEEVAGKNPRLLKSEHTSSDEYKKLWETLSAGKEWHGEFHNVRKDGKFYWESASISPIINAIGETTHFIAIKEDITDRKKIEKQLIKAKEKAEESDRLKLAFLANMSHEIRTPMNGILGFTELLKSPSLAGEEQQEYIRIIEKSGIRMLNIINDIINISKVESGQVEISLSETNVNEQIEYLYNFFKPEAKQKGILLSIDNPLTDNKAIINTDQEKMYAILTNLVKNAIKFTDSGSIDFGYVKKDDFLEFYVKDTGFGISKAHKKIVFERFRQANESLTRTHEGSGLGLAISRAYVEMLGGKIWLESEEGKGSSFYFTIPYITQSESKNKVIPKKVIAKEKTENTIKDLKVLIVEDDAISKLLITIAVKPFSKEIIKVSTGIEAIETCRNNPDIDLVMMDINMPEVGGYEATKQIREFNKDLVIIAQTANGMQSDKEEAIVAGCTDYISKPVNIASLGELIQKLFKK
ncbi:MAG TPA: PAS domain S-box protein [Flavobacterium sp.]